jgi:hypothetical protein
VNFKLIHLNKWSLTELDNMYFWEREIYANLIEDYNNKLLEKHGNNAEKLIWKNH